MKTVKYADEKIGEKELMIAVASIVIGGDILSLPTNLAKDTIGSDRWISLTITGSFLSFSHGW